jgi:hypothetical protein
VGLGAGAVALGTGVPAVGVLRGVGSAAAAIAEDQVGDGSAADALCSSESGQSAITTRRAARAASRLSAFRGSGRRRVMLVC